jgi:hypothetical protein
VEQAAWAAEWTITTCKAFWILASAELQFPLLSKKVLPKWQLLFF